jgi:hypothetical protein
VKNFFALSMAAQRFVSDFNHDTERICIYARMLLDDGVLEIELDPHTHVYVKYIVEGNEVERILWKPGNWPMGGWHHTRYDAKGNYIKI